MQLPTQTFTQLVRTQVAAIQGAAAGLLDFTVGSILRATVESVSQVAQWLQGLIIQLLTVTRFATSVGPDADSFGADYDFPRLGAAFASTNETFGRFSPTLQAIIPVGANVETADGSQQYVVGIDTTNAAYNATIIAGGGYVVPAGTASINVPITATVSGSGANCVAGAINTITSPISGIDYCTNAAAVDNGVNAETDAAYRLRFVAWINSLSRAIRAAVELAATSVALNASCVIVENQGYNGSPQPGFFCVIVNDGSGNPPSTFIAMCATAVEAVRGLTIQYGVFPPVLIPATVSMAISLAAGFDPVATPAAVQAAIETYFAALSIGEAVSWTRLAQLAYDASPGITDVTNMRLNGGQADIATGPINLVQLSSAPLVTIQ